MEILLNQIITFLTVNHLVIIPLLTIFSVVMAFLAWQQIIQGWRFYSSKRRLISQFKSKNTLN